MMLQQRFEKVYSQIESALNKAGRDLSTLKVIAVSKTQPPEKIQPYIDWCGSNRIPCILGENYLQEFEGKKAHLKGNFSTHFIGRYQGNKSKKYLLNFSFVQTVGSINNLNDISKAALSLKVTEYPFLLQINVSGDPDKGGFSVEDSLKLSSQEPFWGSEIKFRGFMTIPDEAKDPEKEFSKLAGLKDQWIEEVRRRGVTPPELELSMGMSGDFIEAINAGSTMVRIGSALFGEREEGK